MVRLASPPKPRGMAHDLATPAFPNTGTWKTGMVCEHPLKSTCLVADRPMLGIAWAMMAVASGSRPTGLLLGVITMAFAALHIHQMAGQTEFHFGIFVLLAFLPCYRDWTVIVVAAAVIAVHHASFNLLQQMGYGALCLTEPSWATVSVHAAYVVGKDAMLRFTTAPAAPPDVPMGMATARH